MTCVKLIYAFSIFFAALAFGTAILSCKHSCPVCGASGVPRDPTRSIASQRTFVRPSSACRAWGCNIINTESSMANNKNCHPELVSGSVSPFIRGSTVLTNRGSAGSPTNNVYRFRNTLCRAGACKVA